MKGIEDSKISVDNTDMQGQFEIKVFELLKNIKVDKPLMIGSIPDY